MRAGHSVASLPDGRMLLFGGHDGYKPLSDLYFYSPDTGKWAPVLSGPGASACELMATIAEPSDILFCSVSDIDSAHCAPPSYL